MTSGQESAPREHAVVRPRDHIENVRRDAERAAAEIAAEDRAEPDFLISNAISWTLGEQDHAPCTGTPTTDVGTAEISNEIAACRTFLESTPWSEQADESISRARHVLNVLEWLTGIRDRPPTYCRETEPGDLVGGRGRIVRADAEIRRMIVSARAKLAAIETSYALGADWHQGVIATLEWTLGHQVASPVHGIARAELPDGARIAIEQREAEDHLAAPMRRPGIPLHFADAVACTCRWLLGDTTRPPVSDDD